MGVISSLLGASLKKAMWFQLHAVSRLDGLLVKALLAVCLLKDPRPETGQEATT